ncbi:Na/Pi cotransporter family protein [Hydrogenovibrio marinus]|uniref:Na+/Pi-cotransporter n=1 Tax=Hydrogenovibrio marinus TaxID=28885 RepID=A0A067A0A4_HYDMR|nr:Na/Pi cotransporter family protein [Hydrogenovibrio marinus]KDN96041.1 Na+/Pi-cotransporter [Hydrogenovibrio marinus]BBN58463.1 Na/Pi cotransporter [Hydrogenovibrio marinus]
MQIQIRPFKTLLLLLLWSSLAFAVVPETAIPSSGKAALNWYEMILQLLGGLAIFLFGLDLMVKGLLSIAGGRMKTLLATLTTNRVMGALSGTLVTAIIQSSSVTSVLVIGFVASGMMTLMQAGSIIMGANLGTTITAQIVAFKIYNLALIMVFAGFLIQFISETHVRKNIGQLLLGLGLLFIGMNLMGEGMSPLKHYEPFLETLKELDHPLFGILIGLAFTALVQSSSATIGIIIVMANQGFLTLPTGIALSMGADIGTCITAILATIGQSRDAIRAALIHVMFNVFGVLLWLPFIGTLAALAIYISPEGGSHLNEMANLAADTPREIANANTLFKLSALILFLPLLTGFVWLTYRLLPILDDEKQQSFDPKYLDDNFLQTPQLAFGAVIMELNVFREKLNNLFQHFINNNYPVQLNALKFEEKVLRQLRQYQHQILIYLSKVSRADLDEKQQQKYVELISVVNILESVMETIENGLLDARHQTFEYQLKVSPTMQELMGNITKEVVKSLNNALMALDDQQKEKALEVFSAKSAIDEMIQIALKHQVKHIQSDESRLVIFRMEMQIVDALKRLHTLAKRIARLQNKGLSSPAQT